MAKTAVYWQKGDSLDYTNKTDQTIPAGTVLVFGKRMGVAGTEIPAGETGSIHVTGVFEIPKKSGVALVMGDPVTFTDENGIDKASSDPMGYAVRDAAAQDAAVLVKLPG